MSGLKFVNREPPTISPIYYFMDPSKSLDHYANRRDLLRSYLEEYLLLSKEYPDVTEQLTFDGFVHFSFAYFRISEQTDSAERLEHEIVRVREPAE